MSTKARRRYTLEEYFALELASEEKYEYFDGEIYNMSGGSPAHEEIIGNIYTALKSHTREKGCRVFLSGLRLKVPTAPPYRYPDLTALCETPRYEKIGGLDALLNPSLIVEVLSPSTELYDRSEKFTHYKSIESFCEYLLISQVRPHATHFVRREQGMWLHEEFNDLDASLRLESLDCELALREVYADVEFPPPAPPPADGRPEDWER